MQDLYSTGTFTEVKDLNTLNNSDLIVFNETISMYFLFKCVSTIWESRKRFIYTVTTQVHQSPMILQ